MTWGSFVNNRLPILNLPDDVLAPLREGKLAYTKARAIAQVKDEDQRRELLLMVIDNDLSLSLLKEHIRQIRSGNKNAEKSIDLRQRFSSTMRRLNKSGVWDNPGKYKKLEKLLSEIEKMIS